MQTWNYNFILSKIIFLQLLYQRNNLWLSDNLP